MTVTETCQSLILELSTKQNDGELLLVKNSPPPQKKKKMFMNI